MMRHRLFWPATTTVAMLAVLIGLGTWQVYRLHWKQGILAQIARAEASPPVPLSSNPEPYTKVEAEGRLRNDLASLYGAEVRDTPTGPKMGGQLIVPLEREGAPSLLVDRGWVPLQPSAPLDLPANKVRLTGFIRPGDHASWFSAADDVPGRHFYTLDPSVIGSDERLNEVAPYVLVVMGDAPASLWPEPAHHLPRPPNNHLSYAITWYGLAAALIVIFFVWVRKGSTHA